MRPQDKAILRRRDMAVVALRDGKMDEAVSHLRKVLALEPNGAQHHQDLAFCHLISGDLPAGFHELDWRFHPSVYTPTSNMPLWDGRPLNGETVVCHFDAGFGDTIQFARFIPQAAALGARIVVIVPPALHRIMTSVEGVSEVFSQTRCRLPLQYYVCPMMRLGYVLRTTLSSIPAAPYLHAEPGPWHQFLSKLPGLKVGLVWAGASYKHGEMFDMDQVRSMRLADLTPVLSVPGCSFVSLQLGEPAVQLREQFLVHDVAARLGDLQDTADLIMGLDLVISVDTSVAHLAGALGKPVWLLNRFDTCWRWMRDRSDSPWYPSMRIADQLPPDAKDAYDTLLSGDIKEGFRKFENRRRSILPGQRWVGQSLAGHKVLLRGAEGGFGDDLMFCRYAPLIAKRGGQVLLLVPRKLSRLFATLDGVTRIIPTDPGDGSKKQANAPGLAVHYRFYADMMSLPFAFGTTLDTIPTEPYLFGNPALWADFLRRLPGLKVGICWAGEARPNHPLDFGANQLRSMKLADMAPLFGVPGCSFVSLQLGPPGNELRKGMPVHDVSRRLKDWRNTADLVAGLDLVISVDTAVCHLVGAMGKPVWMLNRHDTEWRWLRDRADCPWYPSMRIYRQPTPHDWGSVIDEVRRGLSRMVHQANAVASTGPQCS